MRRSTPVSLLMLSALAFTIAPFAARAASPDEGTIGKPANTSHGVKSTLSYTGDAVTGVQTAETAEALCGDPSASSSTVCDIFTLHLDLPSGYWKSISALASGVIDVDIDWADQPGGSISDVDLFVTDAEGNEVGSSTTFNPDTGSAHEHVELPNLGGGDYRIIVTVASGAIESYSATAKLTLKPPVVVPAGQKSGTLNTTAIDFSPYSVVDPTFFGGEPGINGDQGHENTWYIDWPIGTRQSMGQLHKSVDGGDTFRLVTDPACPNRRQPGCATGGGGDTEVALSKSGNAVYFSNQEALANEAVCASHDGGNTFPIEYCNAITSLDPENDRQWMAVYDENTAYIAATAALGESIARTDDGGRTWLGQTILTGETENSPAAPIYVDNTGGPRDGALYVATSRGPMQMNVSRDKGGSFTTYPTVAEPKTGPYFVQSLFIPWSSMDNRGNIYLLWVDRTTHATMLSTMKADAPQNAGNRLGSTWSPPVVVSAAPAKSTILSNLVAGDPGRIVAAYEGANIPEKSDDAPDGTPWYIYAATSTNALCWWSNSCNGSGPSFLQTLVTPRANHYGNICVSGLGCTVNMKDRSLLDFFDTGIDKSGRAGITYVDTNNGLRGGEVHFTKLVAGPLLYGQGSLTGAPARGSIAARRGDARWPIMTGDNYPAADLTTTSVDTSDNGLRFTIKIGATDLASALATGYNTTHLKYLTRWQFGRDTYFVAADYDGVTDSMSYYGGKIDDNDMMTSPTNPGTAYGMTYVRDFDILGTSSNGIITLPVPRDLVGSPKNGDMLFSVQSFVLASAPDDVVSVYTAPDTIDATPPFDVHFASATKVLGGTKTRPRATKGKPLPATGLDDLSTMFGVALLAMSAISFRRLRLRRTP